MMKVHPRLPPDGLNILQVQDKLVKEQEREYLYFFKKNRQIARFEGESNYVDPGPETFRMKDCLVLHNHLQGTSFSAEDVATVIHHNATELRVFAGSYTFILIRPASGWPIRTLDHEEEYTDEFVELVNASLMHAEEVLNIMVMEHNLEDHERDKYINHILWMDFFKKLNIEYRFFGL